MRGEPWAAQFNPERPWEIAFLLLADAEHSYWTINLRRPVSDCLVRTGSRSGQPLTPAQRLQHTIAPGLVQLPAGTAVQPSTGSGGGRGRGGGGSGGAGALSQADKKRLKELKKVKKQPKKAKKAGQRRQPPRQEEGDGGKGKGKAKKKGMRSMRNMKKRPLPR